MIAFGIAGSDLSTLIVELNAIENTKFAHAWIVRQADGPRYVLEAYGTTEGATELRECPSEYVVFARGKGEAIRLFSEITGGVFVEPSALDSSPESSLGREDRR